MVYSIGNVARGVAMGAFAPPHNPKPKRLYTRYNLDLAFNSQKPKIYGHF